MRQEAVVIPINMLLDFIKSHYDDAPEDLEVLRIYQEPRTSCVVIDLWSQSFCDRSASVTTSGMSTIDSHRNRSLFKDLSETGSYDARKIYKQRLADNR